VAVEAGATAPYPRLLGDIGGTRARFAWIESPGAPLSRRAAYEVAGHAGLEPLIARYAADHGLPAPAACALGMAGPVEEGILRLTNAAWAVERAALRASLGCARLLVINDFAALARGIPALAPDEVRRVGGGRAQPGAPIVVLGPGTGLGVSALVFHARGPLAIASEGGHASLAADDEDEAAIVALLRARFGHVSAELVLSGAGLVRLYEAGCALTGCRPDDLQPGDVVSGARRGDADCRAAVARFLAFLGGFAGSVALTFGARGGVYLAGGVVAHLGDAIERSALRDRFESKGRFRGYLERIPTAVVADTTETTLRGADLALDDPG
jgi:glucokinase